MVDAIRVLIPCSKQQNVMDAKLDVLDGKQDFMDGNLHIIDRYQAVIGGKLDDVEVNLSSKQILAFSSPCEIDASNFR